MINRRGTWRGHRSQITLTSLKKAINDVEGSAESRDNKTAKIKQAINEYLEVKASEGKGRLPQFKKCMNTFGKHSNMVVSSTIREMGKALGKEITECKGEIHKSATLKIEFAAKMFQKSQEISHQKKLIDFSRRKKPKITPTLKSKLDTKLQALQNEKAQLELGLDEIDLFIQTKQKQLERLVGPPTPDRGQSAAQGG